MNDYTANILIIEDEQQIRRYLGAALLSDGFKVFEADTLQRGLIEAATRKPDLVILDLGLPDGDGNQFIEEIRQWSQIPIIILSARSDERDKVKALNNGADDYLVKPFGIAELLARVRANLRRRNADRENETPIICFGNIKIDRVNRQVFRNGNEIHLTKLEYRLLMTLLSQPGRVFTHRQLLNTVWGAAYIEQTQYIRIYMGHLRQKLEQDATRPRYLQTETGIGYRLVID
ncbi:two component transcriptional regulator, winged helix family [Tolumonas auensis DSM 9187]|uniref:Two component transcriptional regulator, winged helix family n=1 Tax=Tolumonas auensis (strain DSM 9187 / NBRC 110442 / TA 4) TaxID=595494 RepID=C4LDM0_TOLAT|nr:two-component system response regulator KdpE [Tolumonas auensis]ACQ92816.1 two component transcriptional regulator, winged helix family [Tolumonas auensis DSM 9187]